MVVEDPLATLALPPLFFLSPHERWEGGGGGKEGVEGTKNSLRNAFRSSIWQTTQYHKRHREIKSMNKNVCVHSWRPKKTKATDPPFSVVKHKSWRLKVCSVSVCCSRCWPLQKKKRHLGVQCLCRHLGIRTKPMAVGHLDQCSSQLRDHVISG